ncbi:uncharacterized protein BDW43DRAFT_264262 [Aspergillus alliaceus]|uniref:uncharacterized protein n=1 Tax=Petromyces alliaceus TaxID=209559 RepID=UPI0012A4D2E6|nr:uncharacterized protein BDW43DRAFT_264262 [Aspergillus alliaceus]KAB8237795.1 hypothetical protein BDW43DRAFT_264262 [Aspergillus alliaceus]
MVLPTTMHSNRSTFLLQPIRREALPYTQTQLDGALKGHSPTTAFFFSPHPGSS